MVRLPAKRWKPGRVFISAPLCLFIGACQSFAQQASAEVPDNTQAIVFRPDLYYAEPVGQPLPPLAVRQQRLVIPVSGIGQRRAESMDEYLLALIDQLSTWAAVRGISIEGHTDSEGSQQSNALLSLRRANAVAERLEQLGVESGLLRVEAWGEHRPVADNTTMSGRVANRRVEIIVTGYPQHSAPIATQLAGGKLP